MKLSRQKHKMFFSVSNNNNSQQTCLVLRACWLLRCLLAAPACLLPALRRCPVCWLRCLPCSLKKLVLLALPGRLASCAARLQIGKSNRCWVGSKSSRCLRCGGARSLRRRTAAQLFAGLLPCSCNLACLLLSQPPDCSLAGHCWCYARLRCWVGCFLLAGGCLLVCSR
jgi:hypothetical protein